MSGRGQPARVNGGAPREMQNGHARIPKKVVKKPLVAQVEGRDCTKEVAILNPIATVAFCDAISIQEIHGKVQEAAFGLIMWDAVYLGRQELARFRSLKVIVKVGPGLNNVDIKAAGEMGIAVYHVTGYGIEEAADSTMTMILDMYRMKRTFNSPMLLGGMSWRDAVTTQNTGYNSRRIRGKTLGLIGFGLVGKAVAIRAMALGMKVSFYDPYIEEGFEKSYGVTRVYDLDELLANSDCVSLHCTLTEKTFKIINAASIQLMRSGACLVNISNKALIDETALAAALREGRIGAAGIDAFVSNPNEDPLKDAPYLLRTPGTAYISEASLKEFRESAANEMKTFLIEGVRSRNLRYLVNGTFLNL